MRVERTAGRHREAVQRLAAVDRQAIHDAAADTAAFQCQAHGQLRAAVVRHGFAAEPQAGGVAIDMAVGSVLSRSEENTSELQSLMRISYAVFCLEKISVLNYCRVRACSQQTKKHGTS